jgi:hypothetical protein
LDDYEEGTWTPVIGGSTSESGQSYNYQYGKYVKVGSLVTFTFDVSLATKGTITGTYLQVKGFPFVPVTAIASGAVSYYASLVTGYYWIGFYVDPASNFAYMVGSTSASLSYLGPANVQNGSRLTGSVSFSTV